VQGSSWADGLELVGDDDRLVGLAGALPLRLLAEQIGLRAGISASAPTWPPVTTPMTCSRSTHARWCDVPLGLRRGSEQDPECGNLYGNSNLDMSTRLDLAGVTPNGPRA
jgi:hypothetical protein